MKEIRQWRYRVGTHVVLRYGKHWRDHIGRHGQRGLVACAANGKPFNYLIGLENGEQVIVPGGQLRRLEQS